MNPSCVLLSPECLNQTKIWNVASKYNSDFEALQSRFALYIKALIESPSMDEMPLGLRVHTYRANGKILQSPILGRLCGKNEDVASRDEDSLNRLTLWNMDCYTISLTGHDHYNTVVCSMNDPSLNQKKNLFHSMESLKRYLKSCKPEYIKYLKQESIKAVKKMLHIASKMYVPDVSDFNKDLPNQILCPLFGYLVRKEFSDIMKQNLKGIDKVTAGCHYLSDMSNVKREIANTLLFADCVAAVIGKENLQKGCNAKSEIELTLMNELQQFSLDSLKKLKSVTVKKTETNTVNDMISSATLKFKDNIIRCLLDPAIKPDISKSSKVKISFELSNRMKNMDEQSVRILNDLWRNKNKITFSQLTQSSYLQEWRKININIIKYGSIYGPNDKPTINTQTVDSQEQSVQQPKNTQVQNNTQEYPSQVNKRRGRGR